jgi:hypothetical protein
MRGKNVQPESQATQQPVKATEPGKNRNDYFLVFFQKNLKIKNNLYIIPIAGNA